MLDANIDFEILDATFGNDLAGREQRYCRDLYCARAFRDMSLNEIACSLGHKMALEGFLHSEANYGLILEDDVHIRPMDFERIFAKILPVREPYDAFLRNVHRHRCMIFETSPWLVRASKDAAESTIGGIRQPLRATPSLSKTLRSAAFRLEYNVMKGLFI